MSENPTDVPKAAPSIISNQLRNELIRILQTGDDKHNGAFTIGVAAQVEKFVAAAREILMTEKLAQSDLGSLMRMRKPHLGGAWSGVVGSSLGYDELPSPMISPIVNNENFGVQAIRQLVEVARTMSETPAKLVEALAVARSHNLDDVVAALEKKLGVSKAGSEADAADVPIPTLPDGTPIRTLPDGRPLQ